jgi:hypothetical protein
MNLAEIERLAREATPGPWELSHAGEGGRGGFRITEYYVRLPGADFALAADIVGPDMKPSEANAAYIAACSPSVILRLVEIAKAAQTYYDRYAQDEAEDGAMLAKGWPEDRMYSGCSRRQAEDALALRSALDSAKEQA